MPPTSTIPFFNYPALFAGQEPELTEVILDVCRRGAYILQKDLAEFERHLAEYMGVKHAFGVANGTDAIWLGLMACGIGPGDEVILPSHTYIATAAAVHFVGATPVLADIGVDHMLDPASVEQRITPRTRAIMPVQINGRTCDMAALQAIADRHDLMLLEDAAQGLGSRFQGRMAGTFGRFGTLSFYPAKLLGCFGDGGAVVTDDDRIAEQVALLRDHGRHPATGQVVAWGFNSRLDNLQAAILDFKLKSFDQDVARRRAIAARYQERLGDLPQLTLPPAPDADSRHFDVYQNYELESDRRDELRVWLESNGVRTIIQWAGTPVHRFSALGFGDVHLPATEHFFERCLLLPMNTTLSDTDVDTLCDLIRTFHWSSALTMDATLGNLANPLACTGALVPDGSNPEQLLAQLRTMLLIRRAEEIIGDGVAARQVICPAHLGIGQEAIAVGVAAHLHPTDRSFGGHRSHAHYLALGGDLYGLLAEVLGKEDGCSRGMGGSMHLYAADRGLLGTVPIVAGTVPLAVGAALAAKKDGQGAVAVAWFGDGASEEGVIHESLNLAAIWKLPVLFVCENNLFSSHLHISLRQPSDRVARFAEAHRIPAVTLDGNDVTAVSRAAEALIEAARRGAGPGFLEAVTYRWRGHVGHREDEDVGVNRGDDLALWKRRDPVRRLADSLLAMGALTVPAYAAMQSDVDGEVAAAWRRALEAPYPLGATLMDRVYAESGRCV